MRSAISRSARRSASPTRTRPSRTCAAAPDVERPAEGRRVPLGREAGDPRAVDGVQRAQRRIRLLLPVRGRGARRRAAPAPADEIRVYQPSTRPGAPLPHAWIDDEDGRRRPVKDLVAPGRFLLIAGEDGQAWCDAARQLAAEAGVPLDAVRIGHLDGTCTTRAAPGCAIARSPATARSSSARTGSSPGGVRLAAASPRLRSLPRSARSSPGRSARRLCQPPDMAICSRPAGAGSLFAPSYCISTVSA